MIRNGQTVRDEALKVVARLWGGEIVRHCPC